ncbi:MAG: multiheme c-type cytochrome [Myxococcota bacterium]
MRRLLVLGSIPIAAVSVALARGKKQAEEVAPPPPPPVEAPAPAPPPAPEAPPLFPDGKLPVVLGQLPAGLASLSAQGCNACHWQAHDTWLESAHAHAGESKAFRDSVRTAGNSTVCTQCHLPIAAQHDELAAGYVDGDLARPRLEDNPSFDATLRGEGVTCATCHVRGDTVVGARPSPDAPHPVAVSAELSDSRLCATCHQLSWPGGDKPFYDTYGEWKASAYAAAGVSCQDCHMATGLAEGRTHAFSADPARAMSVLVSLPKASIQRGQPVVVKLTLQNTGAGHAIPTGNPFRAVRVDVVLLDANGKELAPAGSTTFERKVEAVAPYRTVSDNRVAAGGQARVEHTFTPNVKGAPGHGAVEVRLTSGDETVVLQRIGVDVL